jgi:hypothetical protein
MDKEKLSIGTRMVRAKAVIALQVRLFYRLFLRPFEVFRYTFHAVARSAKRARIGRTSKGFLLVYTRALEY